MGRGQLQTKIEGGPLCTFLLSFSMNNRDFSVKSKPIISNNENTAFDFSLFGTKFFFSILLILG